MLNKCVGWTNDKETGLNESNKKLKYTVKKCCEKISGDLSFKHPLSFTSFRESSHPKAFTFGTIGSGRLTLKSYPHDVHVVKTRMFNARSPFWRRSTLGFLWKEWCWSWISSALATSCKELTHWKRLWCWEGLGAGGEGDDRGWDGWMASRTRWTWVWVNSRSWWWTGRPGVLQFIGSQRVGHDWATELNWV